MEGKDMLIRLRTLNRKIPQAMWKMEQAKSNAEPQSPVIDGMPHGQGGFHSKTESGAIKLAELEEMYIALLAERANLIEVVGTAIDKLEKPEERAVMRMRYCRGMSQTDIGDALYRCDRQIRRYLQTAERKVLKYL